MTDTNGVSAFQRVTFHKEREKILGDLQTKSVVLAGLTDDQHQFVFNVRRVEDESIFIAPLAPVGRGIKQGESLQIMFGLSDGQYLLKTEAKRVDEGGVMVPLGQEIYRLQRRNNFRTTVPSHHKITFRLASYQQEALDQGPLLEVADLSAGGVRVRWPEGPELAKPEDGDELSGVLTLLGGKQLELDGLTRRLAAEGKGLQVGIEFRNMSLRDEQALLFACMQIQREQMPRLR